MKFLPNRRKPSSAVDSAKDKKDKWVWPTQDQLEKFWTDQLTDENDKEKLGWINELSDRSSRVLEKRDQAAVSTNTSHWFQRGSAGASAAVATLTGGTLIGSVHGTTATIIGIGAAIVGLAAAGIVAARPEQSYSSDLTQKTKYEQLWWDMRSYAITQLPVADRNGFNEAINVFAKREADIMGAAAPTNTTP